MEKGMFFIFLNNISSVEKLLYCFALCPVGTRDFITHLPQCISNVPTERIIAITSNFLPTRHSYEMNLFLKE